MPIIELQITELLKFREESNKEFFITDSKEDKTRVDVYVQADSDIVLHSSVSKHDLRIKNIAKYANKKILWRDKRVVSHDFGDSTLWTDPANSEFIIEPSEGKKFIVTFIQVRFPKNIKLTASNTLNFQVNLFIEAYGAVVPVVNLQYASVRDIVRKSNTPVNIPFDVVDDLSQNKIIEIQFKYADPDNLVGSPIVLRKSFNENIKMWLSGNTPLLDTQGSALQDETWCVVNGKETYEF